MKRTDITELFPDASKEAIDKLMAINGADVNSAKGNLGTVTAQLETAKNELAQLKAAPGGQSDELKQATDAIAALRAELDTMKTADAARAMREKVSAEKKVPAALLTGDTEEACSAQADAILSFARSAPGYPAVRDAGETAPGAAASTRDRFAEWAKDNF